MSAPSEFQVANQELNAEHGLLMDGNMMKKQDKEDDMCEKCRKRREADIDLPDSTNRPEFPALEGGWSWVIVLASFLSHMLTRGILFATGILFSVWVSYFQQSNSNTAWIGSIATGSALLLGPLSSRSIDRWGFRVTCMFGGCLAAVGFLVSSLGNSIFYLYISYGLIAGAGLGFCYMSAVVAVGEYFNERRSMAFGLAAGGSGCGTIVMAILQQYLLDVYDWQGAMILLAGFSGLHLIVCGALMRPLSSPLNWQTRHGKLRLLQYQSDGFFTKQTNVVKKTGEEETTGDHVTAGDGKEFTKEDKSSCDSGFGGKESDCKVSSGSSKMSSDELEEEKLLMPPPADPIKSPRISLLQSEERPKSQIIHYTPSPMLHPGRILQKSHQDLDTNMEYPGSATSLNIRHIRSPAQRRFQQIRNRTASAGWKSSANSFQSINSLNKFNNNPSIEPRIPAIRSGDAMYLSSLSVVSGRSEAQKIKQRNINESLHSLAVSRSRSEHTTGIQAANTPMRKSYCSSHYSTWDILEADTAIEYCPDCDNAIVINTSTPTKPPSVFCNGLFLMLAFNQFFTYLGVLVPYVHLTEKAKLMGFDSTKAAALISFIGAGNIIGKVVLGILCDYFSRYRFLIFFLTQLGMGVCTIILPFFLSYESIVIFCLVFGFCFGNYAAFPSLMAEYVGLDRLSEAMGYIVFLEGAAAIIGPPLAGAIYDATESYGNAFFYAGGIILFSWALLLFQPFLKLRVTGKRSRLLMKLNVLSSPPLDGDIEKDEA